MSGGKPKRAGVEIGAVFADRYVIERKLGEGAAAEVFLARNVALGRLVALKILRGMDDDRQAALFLREARILRSLPAHPALVGYLDIGVVDGVAYLVEEYVEGVTLDEWQHRAPDVPAIIEMYGKIADGLAALHATGVIHRDLKPSNVLVGTTTGQPMLTDLGLALRPSETDTLTRSTIVGTPIFLSPEAIRGDTAVGAPADVYSLGVMLYAAIVGDLPWGHAVISVGVLASILEGISDGALARLGSRAPAEIVALVREMLARNPDERPEASVVARRLQSRLAREEASPKAAGDPHAALPAARSSEAGGRVGPLRYLSVIAIGATLLIGAVLLKPFVHPLSPGVGRWYSPFGAVLDWRWTPGPTLVLVARIAGWVAVALLGGGVAAASAIVYRRWRRHAEAAVAEALPVLARIQAIETQLNASPTKSMVIALDQIDANGLKQQLRESVVLALQDLRGHLGLTDAGAPSDLGRALEVIAGLTRRKKTPVRPNRAKQIALYVGLFAGGATAITGVTGALGAVDVWHPNRAPEITRVSPSGERVRRGASVRLAVEAKDPDGDPLTFAFEVAGQTLTPTGPTVLWRPPADLQSTAVTFKVTVDDGHKKTVGYGTFVVDSPPVIARLDVPARVRAGETKVLSASATDPDGDEVKYAWAVSAGDPLASAAIVFTWRAPAHPGRVDVVLIASDGLDTAERRTVVTVVAR